MRPINQVPRLYFGPMKVIHTINLWMLGQYIKKILRI
jgi:hypothetical protein